MRTRLWHYGQWAGIGAFLGVSFLHPYLWWCVIPGLAAAIRQSQNAPTARAAFWGGALAGVVKTLFVLNWLWTMGFGDLLQMSSQAALLFAIGFVWMGSSVAMGIPFGLFSLTAFRARQAKSYSNVLLLPVVLVVSEVAGSLVFGMFVLGTTSPLFSFDFSFGYLGYPLAHNYWLGFAAVLGGVYALSLLVGILAAIVASCVARYPNRRLAGSAIGIGLLIVSGMVPVPASVVGETSVAAVYTFYTANNEASKLAREADRQQLQAAVQAALVAGAQYVIMPETVTAFPSQTDPEVVFTFLDKYATQPVVFIDSFVEQSEAGQAYVAAVLYDNAARESQVMHKQYLLPYGEYFPHHMHFLFRVAGLTMAEALDRRTVYEQGDGEPVAVAADWPQILFCSENISPFVAFNRTRTVDTPFIAHMVSHGWFRNPDTLWNQLDMMMVTNARFSRTPIVQAGNSTPLRAFDAEGRLLRPTIIHANDGVAVALYKI